MDLITKCVYMYVIRSILLMFMRSWKSLTKTWIQPKWKIFMEENSLSITAHTAGFHLSQNTPATNCIFVHWRCLVAASTASSDKNWLFREVFLLLRLNCHLEPFYFYDIIKIEMRSFQSPNHNLHFVILFFNSVHGFETLHEYSLALKACFKG